MPTLKEMNYRVQEMPDGCWNCEHHRWSSDRECLLTKGKNLADMASHVAQVGICDNYKKEAV